MRSRQLSEAEATNLSKYIAAVIGDDRGFVLIVVECSDKYEPCCEVVSSLANNDMAVTILEAAIESIQDGDEETFSTGGSI